VLLDAVCRHDKNVVAAGYWPDTTICAYLDAALQRLPDKTAVIDLFGRLTYAGLGCRVDRLLMASTFATARIFQLWRWRICYTNILKF